MRKMRRFKQQLSQADCLDILDHGTSGVLALSGSDGWPYAIPLSYVYADGSLFFHAARAGHKLDLIAQNPKASFCVIAQDQIVPEEFTTYFKSVIAFGPIRVLEEPEEKRRALTLLSDKYSPNRPEAREAEIAKSWDQVCMLELKVEDLTGKQAIELVTKTEA